MYISVKRDNIACMDLGVNPKYNLGRMKDVSA